MCAKSVPWVRIPLSPPELYDGEVPELVYRDGLENRCAGSRTVGSNPTLSARNCCKGAVAQMGERIPRTDEAGGSTPLCSIKVSSRARWGASGAL